MIMRKLVFILVVLFSNVDFAQVYETGISYNFGQIVGEDSAVGSFLEYNMGIVLKKNMNPRIAYRITATNLKSNDTKLTELSAGIDFNFSKYNQVRPGMIRKGTYYVIFEVTSLFYNNGEDKIFTFALPMGLGYKKPIFKNLLGAVEIKGRVALTDKLDNHHDETKLNFIRQNKTTLDAYYYIGTSLYYTFGWPRGSKNQTRF